MKKSFFYLSLAGLVLALSCGKQDDTEYTPDGQIAFRTSGALLDVSVDTKASVVNEASLQSGGFNVSCTTGSAGSESTVWNDVAFSYQSSVYKAASTTKAWPASNANYNFYAANAEMSFAADGTTVSVANNNTDVVCAYLPYGTTSSTARYKVTNTLNFEHIFARIGGVTISAADGYTVTGVTVTITPNVSGSYNIRTGAGQTDATGWSAPVAGSPVTIASSTGTTANDLYLIPGTYTLTAAWTAEKGGYSQSFSGATCEVTVQKGKVNTIAATLGGDATEIGLTVSVPNWDNNTVAIGTYPLHGPNYIYFTGDLSGHSNVNLTVSEVGSQCDFSDETLIFVNGNPFNWLAYHTESNYVYYSTNITYYTYPPYIILTFSGNSITQAILWREITG